MARLEDPPPHSAGRDQQNRRILNPSEFSNLGCVVIGRNEGRRLQTCLQSLAPHIAHIVYVDSGSTDGSVEFAQSLGVAVVELDLSAPFTAARARNAGYKHLLQTTEGVELVQFVDGDCEVVAGWIATATQRMVQNPRLAAVCGRRRERHPERSIFNRVCDVEWDTPIGPTLACGGDAMMRAEALVAVDGFDPTIIAGEEPELCVRLRAAGWIIERLDTEMTLHDAAITRPSQWWRRCVRAGHAFAEGAALHGGPPERHWVAESRRVWFWGAAVPAVAIGASLPTLGLSLSLLAGYPVSTLRNYKYTRARGRSPVDSAAYALSCTLGRFPEMQGMLRYHLDRRRGRRARIIEY